ncbi:MAG: hypothetical protein AAGJ12_00595 [Bacteroidota bacterium]
MPLGWNSKNRTGTSEKENEGGEDLKRLYVDLVNNKILDAVVETLSIKELEAILVRKKRERDGIDGAPKLKPMSEREKQKAHWIKVMVSMGIIYPP